MPTEQIKLRWLIPVWVVLLMSAAIVSAQPSAPPVAGEITGDQMTGALESSVSIQGHVRGLYPGRMKRVQLRLRNRTGHPLVVTSIRAKATHANQSCSSDNLRTHTRGTHRRIPARSTEHIRYRVRMIPNASDACQGASFPLRYSARTNR
jgi:hypothetical protein